MPEWLLLALVACMLLGVVATAMPSPRLRQQMRLRRRAASLGLEVRLLGDAARRAVPGLDPSGVQVAYRLAYPAAATGLAWSAQRAPGGWRWQSAPPAADAAARWLAELPPTVRAVVAEADAVSVYWDEADDGVDAIHAALKGLRALPGMFSQAGRGRAV